MEPDEVAYATLCCSAEPVVSAGTTNFYSCPSCEKPAVVVPKNDMSRHDNHVRLHFLQAIADWLRICEQEGKPVGGPRKPGTSHSLASSFRIAADHSYRGGLLGWLAAGEEPLDHAPPINMSRPWHRLVKEGRYEGGLFGVHPSLDALLGDTIVINQTRWQLIETIGTRDYRVAYRNGETWRLWCSDSSSKYPHDWIWVLERESP
jgi:hypothetical protein